ncbi:hypothetical protein B0T25DRAFT_233022 [Lasiosphaeria hispida]|uniref:Uncharacterized protein n=1 Tax=Lasiosphaeria hispida TaxID=260671 RepID=A0AAJ0HDX8_9PEZI|nr:hypothetical protein B0T25DRAFT_233022 [Lasiosphaeria hispida]
MKSFLAPLLLGTPALALNIFFGTSPYPECVGCTDAVFEVVSRRLPEHHIRGVHVHRRGRRGREQLRQRVQRRRYAAHERGRPRGHVVAHVLHLLLPQRAVRRGRGVRDAEHLGGVLFRGGVVSGGGGDGEADPEVPTTGGGGGGGGSGAGGDDVVDDVTETTDFWGSKSHGQTRRDGDRVHRHWDGWYCHGANRDSSNGGDK